MMARDDFGRTVTNDGPERAGVVSTAGVLIVSHLAVMSAASLLVTMTGDSDLGFLGAYVGTWAALFLGWGLISVLMTLVAGVIVNRLPVPLRLRPAVALGATALVYLAFAIPAGAALPGGIVAFSHFLSISYIVSTARHSG